VERDHFTNAVRADAIALIELRCCRARNLADDVFVFDGLNGTFIAGRRNSTARPSM
jgi:hypothetical protein